MSRRPLVFLCIVAAWMACAPDVGEPCAERGAQSGCPPTSICESLDAPSPLCEACRVEIEETRICRLRCEADADCEADEECVDVIRFEPDVRYQFCRPVQ